MFRRSKPDTKGAATGSGSTSTRSSGTATAKPGGKGRPTPTRKEAEAARRARVKAPADRKEAARLQRQRRADANARTREAMRTGDDRYLPTRDKGPVRRFVRDFVDARLSMAEMLLPLLFLIAITASFAPQLSNGLWSATILLTILDTAWLVIRLRRELARRFPGRDTKGAVLYGVTRSVQLRWFRLPKRQVRLGQRLPERY